MVEQMILALCINLQTPDLGKYYGSCTQALTAASIQTHFKPYVENIQHNFEKKIAEQTGEQVWAFAGFGYSTYVKQQINLTTSAKPVVDNITLSITVQSQAITLTWLF